jgi:hypothetical protein
MREEKIIVVCSNDIALEWCCTYFDARLFPVWEHLIPFELSTHSWYFLRLRVAEQHFPPNVPGL